MTTFTHILCPVDFSEESRHALRYAIALARERTLYQAALGLRACKSGDLPALAKWMSSVRSLTFFWQNRRLFARSGRRCACSPPLLAVRGLPPAALAERIEDEMNAIHGPLPRVPWQEEASLAPAGSAAPRAMASRARKKVAPAPTARGSVLSLRGQRAETNAAPMPGIRRQDIQDRDSTGLLAGIPSLPRRRSGTRHAFF